MTPLTWREAMATALYAPGGFFVSGAGPAAHFRTSAHASAAFGVAVLRLLARVDAALEHPDRLDVVDVGAGRGELLGTLARLAPPELARRLRLTAVELAPRPEPAPAGIEWRDTPPDGVTGLLLATEWLDNVPLDLAEHGPLDLPGTDRLGPADGVPPGAVPADGAMPDGAMPDGAMPDGAMPDDVTPGDVTPDDLTPDDVTPEPPEAGRLGMVESGPAGWRYVLVDPATGVESPGGEVGAADAAWLGRWWPPVPGGRAEIGRPRDVAWAGAVATLHRGVALAVDYGHLAAGRPPGGTLTGFRAGRQVPPVPDGSRDITAHVAVDSAAAAGSAAAGLPYTLVSQRAALRALGTDGRRPPLALAGTDPAAYVRALAAASAAAELTDPAGLGGHWWLLQPVGVDLAAVLAR